MTYFLIFASIWNEDYGNLEVGLNVMSNDSGVNLQQLLNFSGKFEPHLLWELLHSLSFYLKTALKGM